MSCLLLFLVAVLGWLWVSNNAVVTSGNNIRRKSAVFLVFLDWMMNENKGEGCKVLVVTSAWKQ